MRSMKQAGERALGKLEEDIMDALKGNVILTELEIRNRTGRTSALHATLNRMMVKGLITREKRHYKYHYRKRRD